MRSYRPEELFDADGRLVRRARARCRRTGERRMSANPHANGGLLLRDARPARLPPLRRRGATRPAPPSARRRACSATFLRDVIAANPDELPPVRAGRDRVQPPRRRLRGDRPRRGRRSERRPTRASRPDGRVMEVLSEHLCQGWLEGYLLTGRHGLFNCYEAFIHIIDSMFNQHAKWLKVTRRHPLAAADRRRSTTCSARTSGGRTTTGSRTRTRASSTTSSTRRPRSSASTCRRTPTRCCRWPTTACAAATTSTSSSRASSRRSRTSRWTTRSCTARAASASGPGRRTMAATRSPTWCSACCGDVPTLETLAAAAILREQLPDLRVRVVNVVDLMRLQPATEHPHGLSGMRVRRPLHRRSRRWCSPTTATRR